MSKNNSDAMGSQPIGQLIIQQAVPAAIGILIMSLNMIVDTIFVGRWIGAMAIAAITVVMPISFFISSIGMAIGVGGASIISRAIGASNYEKANQVFGNQIVLGFGLSVLLTVTGLYFKEEALLLFGAKGDIFPPASIYYTIVMIGVPFLALVMVGNPIIRAIGKPKVAMTAMIIPAIGNIILDYIFIYILDMGMAGAAWATSISFALSAVFIIGFFFSKHNELLIKAKYLILNLSIVKEISALGGVTLARQGVVSILSIVLNHSLFLYGGEISIAIYGIISRMLMFALFPILGITQGFLPIAGFNYGAENFDRVKASIKTSIVYAMGLGFIVFALIMIFPESIVRVFTDDIEVLQKTPNALRIVFAITPLIAIQLIGAGYFQAIGKAVPALLLTLTKQGFFLIPLILILPSHLGLLGVWIAFPIADFLSTAITAFFLHREVKKY